jgi:hypothetical protein
MSKTINTTIVNVIALSPVSGTKSFRTYDITNHADFATAHKTAHLHNEEIKFYFAETEIGRQMISAISLRTKVTVEEATINNGYEKCECNSSCNLCTFGIISLHGSVKKISIEEYLASQSKPTAPVIDAPVSIPVTVASVPEPVSASVPEPTVTPVEIAPIIATPVTPAPTTPSLPKVTTFENNKVYVQTSLF